jgi:large subunit ribosomal protein L16
MLMPKKVKFRKQQRGRRKGKAWRGSGVDFGDFGLRTLDVAWLTARQIEAARVALSRHLHKGGKLWIRVFPDKPVTKKPWVAVVKPGRILFEVEGIPEREAREAFRRVGHKLPVKTVFVSRAEVR